MEVVRRGIDAFNARDLDRFMEDSDPDIELHSRFIAVGGVYRGEDGLRRWHLDLDDAWEYLQLETDKVIEVDDDTILFLATLDGKGRGSGLKIRQDVAQVVTFRAGKVVRIVVYTEPTEAFEAVGLSE